MIRHYLQLVRFPGIFTAFTNILLGYSVVQGEQFGWHLLALLLTTSGSLFLAGMALNDYFDHKIDKKERPQRPIPSGRVPPKNALTLGIIFLVIASISAIFVGFETITVTIAMSLLIFSYDFKVKKNNVISILTLSSIRFLNVILGASIALSFETLFIAIPLAIFVSGISIFARYESSHYSKKSEITNVIIVLATIVAILFIIFDKITEVQIGFIILFTASVFVPYLVLKFKNSRSVQKIITAQLLAITILDATIISAYGELSYAIVALMLYIPAFVAVRKLYVT